MFIELYEISKTNHLPFTTMAIYLKSTQRCLDQETCMNIPNFNYACISFGRSMKGANGKKTEHIS